MIPNRNHRNNKQNISVEWVQSSSIVPSLYVQGNVKIMFSDISKPFELIFFFLKKKTLFEELNCKNAYIHFADLRKKCKNFQDI